MARHNIRAAWVCTFSALGAFLFGLDMGYIGPILEDNKFKRDVVHMTDWNQPDAVIESASSGFIVSIFALGCMCSAFPVVSGFLLDRFGRKVSMLLGSLVFMVGAIVQAFSSNITAMLLGRLLSGFSIGILSTVVPLYQSEMAPPHLRGSFTSLHQVMIVFGAVVACFADEVLLPLDHGWRLAILMPVLPGLIFFLGIFFLPRSPRWLVQHGKHEAALKVLQSMREQEDAQSELNDIVVSDQEEAKASGESRCAELCSGRILRLLSVGILLQLLQQLNGINAFIGFGPRVFKSLGLDASLLQTIMMVVLFFATLPAMYFIERCGRRILLLCGALGMLVSSTVITFVGLLYARSDSKMEVDDLAGLVIVASIFVFTANFAYSWGPVTWVYCAEIFPLKVRAQCVGLTTMFEWAGVFIVNQSTPMLLSFLGFGGFGIFATFCLAAFVFALWLPETKGVPLEHMDQIFDARFGRDRQHGFKGAELDSSHEV